MPQRNRIRLLLPILALALGLSAAGFTSGVVGQARAQSQDKSVTETLGDIFRDALGGSEAERPAEPEAPGGEAPARRDDGSRTRAETEGQLRQVPSSRSDLIQSFSPLVKKTAPAVVNVYADRTVVRRSPFEGDPFFEQFFGRSLPHRTQKQSSLGSGVIVDPSGIIVTNNHVISGADEVRVALSDGREFESEVILKDERFDLAVLKLNAEGEFPTIGFGDSDALEVGDIVLAIGNPFGVGQTVTSGIVSALARNQLGISDFGFFIQTDAAINPGNSGGALIDMNGDLIGINTAIFSRSGGSNGIGFAIPANLVRAFVLSAEAGRKHFDPPYIGATFQAVTPDIAEALGMEKSSGALVVSVEAEGPAAKAGLKPGDVITGFNGQTIEHPDALGYRLATASAGDQVTLDVFGRDGATDVAVTLEKTPEEQIVRPVAIRGDNPFAGISVAPLTRTVKDRLRLPSEIEGLVVTAVNPRSPAAQYGFRERDVITGINGVPVSEAEVLQAALDESGYLIRFELIRNGRRIRQIFNR